MPETTRLQELQERISRINTMDLGDESHGMKVGKLSGRLMRNTPDIFKRPLHEEFEDLPPNVYLVTIDGQPLRMCMGAAGVGSDAYAMILASPDWTPVAEGDPWPEFWLQRRDSDARHCRIS